MSVQLTKNALQRIVNGENVPRPVLQILAYKSVGTPDAERYRFIMSDGDSSYQSCIMLGPELIQKLKLGEFERLTVIQLNNYVCNAIDGKRVIVMTEPMVIKKATDVGGRIGTPTTIGGPTGGQAPLQANQNQNRASTMGDRTSMAASSPARSSYVPKSESSPGVNKNSICPINMLNPFQGKWTIKGRCSNKGPIREWNKATGTGKLFSFDLTDSSGGIRVTAFNQECEKFHEMVQLGKTYIVSRANVKQANKKFCEFEHEMTLNQDSAVEVAEEDYDVPEIKYDFKKLTEIEGINNPDAMIDVAGVVRKVGEMSVIQSAKLQKELRKRDISLVDDSEVEVSLTLWNDDAENFAGTEGSVVVAKKARVSEFQGKSLGIGRGGYFLVDPPSHISEQLKGWYSQFKDKLNPRSLSGTGGGGQKGDWKLLAQALYEAQQTDRVNFSARARIVHMGRTNFYSACPGTGTNGKPCNRKVHDLNNGEYKCEACRKTYDNFLNRAIQSVLIQDETTEFWATLFDADLQKIISVSTDRLKELKENSEKEYSEIMGAANCTPHVFRITARKEYYQDQQRIKLAVNEMTDMEPVTTGRKLLELIKQMKAF
ncbi:Replication protein A 70 kDa DNA-binding subunit [Halotydeus destructor]|nr:Replication protein A 70 kDa DNA-binding subunit [Halotydeus destructor]